MSKSENWMHPDLMKLVLSGKFNSVEVSPYRKIKIRGEGEFLEADPSFSLPEENYEGWGVYLIKNMKIESNFNPVVHVADFHNRDKVPPYRPGTPSVRDLLDSPLVKKSFLSQGAAQHAAEFGSILLLALGFNDTGDLAWIYSEDEWRGRKRSRDGEWFLDMDRYFEEEEKYE